MVEYSLTARFERRAKVKGDVENERKSRTVEIESVEIEPTRSVGLSLAGRFNAWVTLEKLRGLLRTSQRQDYSYAVLMGMTLVRLGELDEAFVWLNRSADLKHPGIPTLRVDPLFDGIRSDPRFEQLVKRVGI